MPPTVGNTQVDLTTVRLGSLSPLSDLWLVIGSGVKVGSNLTLKNLYKKSIDKPIEKSYHKRVERKR